MGLLSKSRRITFRDGTLESYRFPGRWMSDAALDELRGKLVDIARERLGALPGYGVFDGSRAAWSNRIVNLFYRGGDARPAAFSALVHCPVAVHGRRVDVVNLGLTIARADRGAPSPLGRLYFAPLVQHWVRRALRPFWIVTFTAKPRTVGVITDGFTDVWPDYRRKIVRTPIHRAIAEAVFAHERAESGVGASAALDAERSVVLRSCTGPSAVLREAFGSTPKYAIAAANDFCRAMLDYAAGDEFLLVGRVDFKAAWRNRDRQGELPC